MKILCIKKMNICIRVILLYLFLVGTNYSFAQQCEHLEERIKILEERIRNLELQLNIRSTTVVNEYTVTTDESKYETYNKPSPDITPKSNKKIVSSKESISKIIRARVFKKKLQSTEIGKRGVSLLIALTNTTHKDIISFKGTVFCKDYSGIVLTSFPIEFNKLILSYNSESWFGEVPYDPLSEGYKVLLSTAAEDIKTSLELTEVVFSDGTVETAEE